ncbi:MAG: glycosyltransferase [Anaerolineales bacterium]|jgi:glycosyltransferase involved in cell wall biosynthesis
MRILQVNTTDRGGGAEGATWNLFQSYRNRGHPSWLAVGRKLTYDPDVFLIPNKQYLPGWTRFWRKISEQIASGPFSFTAKLAWGMGMVPLGKQWVESKLGRENFNWPGTRDLLDLPPQYPEIVHCHNLHANYFDLRLLPWLSAQAPLILNLHDAWLLSGHCAHSFNCERWKIGCGQCPDLTIYPAISRDATSYNWERKRGIYSKSRLYIVTVSQWLAQKVQESMLQGVSCQVIPNGIALNIFHPGDKRSAREQLGIPQHLKVVLYAANGGRYSRWRSFDQLEAALIQLANLNFGDLMLICLGELKSSQETITNGLHAQYRLFERDPDCMALYYQAADIYVSPALAESFGKAVIEAMACGTPVVATKVGGNIEQITDGVTGCLVPISDVAAMAEAIQRLLGDENLRKTMGSAAAEYARRHFSLELQVDSFLNWYTEVRSDWLEWSKL